MTNTIHLLATKQVNTVLTAIGLGENKVGYTGATAIAEAHLCSTCARLLTLTSRFYRFLISYPHNPGANCSQPDPDPDPDTDTPTLLLQP